SRCAVADDLDGDGRVDLILTTLEVWPETKQTLRVFKNVLSDGEITVGLSPLPASPLTREKMAERGGGARGRMSNWIGFRFHEEAGKSPVGARVTLHFDGRSAVRQIVTGDSFRSQHASTVHFGLGKAERVDSVEIRWQNGQTMTLREPAVNRYHF